MNDFCKVYNLFSLIKEPTCFKNPYNPSCIDLFLTNRPRSFQNALTIELLKIDLNNAELSEFTEIFLSILDKYTPKKQKFRRANNSNFVTKNLRKAIMKRSKLRNKYLRERTNEAKSLYNKQKNLCVSILRNNKRYLTKQQNCY